MSSLKHLPAIGKLDLKNQMKNDLIKVFIFKYEFSPNQRVKFLAFLVPKQIHYELLSISVNANGNFLNYFLGKIGQMTFQ